MHNADIIHLTEKGETKARNLADFEYGDARDDILSYLIAKDGYKGSCEEIAMNTKILHDQLKDALGKLEQGGYIATQSPEGYSVHHEHKEKYSEEPLPKWTCKSCGTQNIAHAQDPRTVYCSNCGTRHTVTGRDIHGQLYVQQFMMR